MPGLKVRKGLPAVPRTHPATGHRQRVHPRRASASFMALFTWKCPHRSPSESAFKCRSL